MRLITKFWLLGALLLSLPSAPVRADVVPIDDNALATLAVQDHGRKKPFTTFAKEMLLSMSGKAELPVENGPSLAPERVLLDLWFKPEGWDGRPLIMLNFLELKKTLGLPVERSLFSYKELIGQKALMDLLDEGQKLRQAGQADNLSHLQKEAENLGERLQIFQDCVNGEKQAIVPNAGSEGGRWVPIQNVAPEVKIWPPTEVSAGVSAGPATTEAATKFISWYQAYRLGDLATFNTLTPQVVDALRLLAPQYYPPAASLRFEHNYMTLHPFRQAWIIYLLALLVLLLTAIWGRDLGYRVGWVLVLAGLGFEIYGFVCRIIISGRPPVTNLYETVIWVSFVAMLISVILEAIYRQRYFFYAGLAASIMTLIIADSQPTILDSAINPLTAVLRNNMWLSIHVLTIVSSYAAFALTAALGHIALTMTLWGRRYAKQMAEVQFFIYRAMQIGILLLATGTILGGVWANYSWGRFWGWDPKETWALITLLCYLALLHGRLAGWWKGFGLAVGSVVCFLSVMMSWYGVNFILGQNGKSLHSYGLSTGGLSYATGFALFEVIFVAIILVWHRRQLVRAK